MGVEVTSDNGCPVADLAYSPQSAPLNMSVISVIRRCSNFRARPRGAISSTRQWIVVSLRQT